MAVGDAPHQQEASPEMIEAREREERALAMKKIGANYPEIAQALGYHDRSGAKKAVSRALKRMGQEDAVEIRQIMVEQLNDLYRRTTEIYTRTHPLVSNGKVVRDAEGNTLDDDGVKLHAIATLLRVQERTSKLLGLDAPRAVELSGPNGEAIPLEVRAAQVVERLRALPAPKADEA